MKLLVETERKLKQSKNASLIADTCPLQRLMREQGESIGRVLLLFWRKKYKAALLKPYNENVSGQEAHEKHVVADEKPANKNLDNVPGEKR